MYLRLNAILTLNATNSLFSISEILVTRLSEIVLFENIQITISEHLLASPPRHPIRSPDDISRGLQVDWNRFRMCLYTWAFISVYIVKALMYLVEDMKIKCKVK